jgi:class 3 adenylate cyclase
VELPSGTVTFLFTDIEGSTHLWDIAPDAMRQALALHDEIVRAGGHRGPAPRSLRGCGFWR